MSRVEKHAAEEAVQSTSAIDNRASDTTASDNTARDSAASDKSKKKKGKITPLGKAISFIGSFIMWAVILLCLVIMAPRLVGIKSFVVISGSMEPAIPVGCMVYAKEVDPKTLIPGDIIVYYKLPDGSGTNVTPVTHRVVENNTETGEITTKGDANDRPDLAPVTYYNVEGKVIYAMRRLGYLASPLSSTTGKVAAFMIILAGYLLSEAGNKMRRKD